MRKKKSFAKCRTCFYLCDIQSKKTGKEMAKTAVVNLVDLAGSERVDSTGATGDRLKEVFKEKSQFMIMSLCLEH